MMTFEVVHGRIEGITQSEKVYFLKGESTQTDRTWWGKQYA